MYGCEVVAHALVTTKRRLGCWRQQAARTRPAPRTRPANGASLNRQENPHEQLQRTDTVSGRRCTSVTSTWSAERDLMEQPTQVLDRNGPRRFGVFITFEQD